MGYQPLWHFILVCLNPCFCLNPKPIQFLFKGRGEGHTVSISTFVWIPLPAWTITDYTSLFGTLRYSVSISVLFKCQINSIPNYGGWDGRSHSISRSCLSPTASLNNDMPTSLWHIMLLCLYLWFIPKATQLLFIGAGILCLHLCFLFGSHYQPKQWHTNLSLAPYPTLSPSQLLFKFQRNSIAVYRPGVVPVWGQLNQCVSTFCPKITKSLQRRLWLKDDWISTADTEPDVLKIEIHSSYCWDFKFMKEAGKKISYSVYILFRVGKSRKLDRLAAQTWAKSTWKQLLLF